jgi:glyoxylase-like metal-dependent hydrolase (beta-lactamase superfamily II)
MSEFTYTVLDFAASSLNKTSVIVSDDTESVVIDAAFTRADGHRIVAAVLDSGTRLTSVLITAGDPDFYFGAEVIADAFPEARFLAPADVIEHIARTYEGKLEAWAHLGSNLPTRLVEIEPFAGTLTLGGRSLELRRASEELGDHAWFVFEPEQRTILGGVLLFEGLHVWTADTATRELREAWIAALDRLEALQPTYVVAGHRIADAPTDLTPIRHTRDYLRFFESAIAAAPDAAAAEKALIVQYPDAGLVVAANLGTKVAKGEMTWG